MLDMIIPFERFLPFLINNAPSRELIQEKNESGRKNQLPTLARSLLLTAAIGFGIKLDHDRQQAIAELAKPAFTLSQLEQRRVTVNRATQDKKAWEAVGLSLAFILALRMERASKDPTIDGKHKPKDELPDFWIKAIAEGKDVNNQ